MGCEETTQLPSPSPGRIKQEKSPCQLTGNHGNRAQGSGEGEKSQRLPGTRQLPGHPSRSPLPRNKTPHCSVLEMTAL